MTDSFSPQSANPASFVGLELDAIAAVVIGDTLLTGRVGFVPGTLRGVLLLFIVLQKPISARADSAR